MTEFRKRAIVTGGSRGIGRACCLALGREGFYVTVNYNKSREAAELLAEEISGRAVKADVRDYDKVCELVKGAGGAGVLVVNAGISQIKLFTETEPEDWREIFSVNVDGAYNVCRHAVPYMVREHWGRIIIISSMWGVRGASCEVAYSASKAALIGMTKALAKELGPSGITVNCIAPGVIDTDMNSELDDKTLEELRYDTPVMRLGKPEDVAELCAFLASDRAEFITGQVISADGGFSV